MTEDGLYQVTAGRVCAGFIVQDGLVVDCAPILRNRLGYWKTRARRIDEEKCPYGCKDGVYRRGEDEYACEWEGHDR